MNDSLSDNISEVIQQAELKKIEAQTYRIHKETEEIERRLKVKWWMSHNLAQYLVAILVSSAVLFGWTRAYLEPILRREAIINDLEEKRNSLENEVLDANIKVLNEKKDQIEVKLAHIAEEKERLEKEKTVLENEKSKLQEKQLVLAQIVEGLKIVVNKVESGQEKYFSILNSRDSINKLRDYGWKLWSDNYYGWLGYYLVVEYKSSDTELKIIVGREFELDALKDENPEDWMNKVNDITKSEPLLILDYSYIGLAVHDNALVGGVLYFDEGEEKEFYAPLKEWSSKLGAVLNK